MDRNRAVEADFRDLKLDIRSRATEHMVNKIAHQLTEYAQLKDLKDLYSKCLPVLKSQNEVINRAKHDLEYFRQLVQAQEEAMCVKVNKEALEHFERFCKEQYLDRD